MLLVLGLLSVPVGTLALLIALAGVENRWLPPDERPPPPPGTRRSGRPPKS
jgi:hypothetical protein